MQPEYRSGLATLELIVEVRRLLATERRTEQLICRYLADLADRVQEGLDNNLWGFADELHAARCIFGLGVRDTRERVRVGRALRELPRVEAAFISGEVPYSRVRELTRVAEPSTEMEWLDLARTLDMRAFEWRVAAARKGAERQVSEPTAEVIPRTDKPARTEWLTQNTVRVTFELSADTMGDGDALAAVAREALSAQHQDPDASDPRCSVVVYECESCGKSELDTSIGPLELEPASAAALCCGKSEVHLATEGRAIKRGGPSPAALRRAVMLRDRCGCRVPGESRRRYVDVHHIIPRGSGGQHSRNNCLLLCTTHHHLLHDGKLVEHSRPAYWRDGKLWYDQGEAGDRFGYELHRSLSIDTCSRRSS